MFGLFWGDWTILIVLPAMIFAMIAQVKVKSTFSEYNRRASRSGLTASQAAVQMLHACGVYDVQVLRDRGWRCLCFSLVSCFLRRPALARALCWRGSRAFPCPLCFS